MILWILVTFAAALTQGVRTAWQKQLKGGLGDLGASYVRFLYAIPFAWAWIALYAASTGARIPVPDLSFFMWVTLAGVTQIIFTVLLVTMFSHRSFAAGTAFSKTEVIQAAIFEAIILGHVVSLQVGVAIVMGVVAVLMLSLAKTRMTVANLIASLGTRQSVIGLASGAFLGLCTVAYRAATDHVQSDDVIVRAAVTAGVVVLIQSALMGAWMAWRARDQLVAALLHWRQGLGVGLVGAFSTFCWFVAFSLHAVAPVRAVGQVELLFVLGISIFYFGERVSRREILAMLVLAVSIIMVLLG